MGNWTKCPIRNDKNGERTRTQHSTVTQTIQPIPITFHSRTERTTQQGRLFRFEKRIKRNGRRRLEENTGGGKKLRVRNYYGSRTFGLKIPIAHREIHRRLRIKKEN